MKALYEDFEINKTPTCLICNTNLVSASVPAASYAETPDFACVCVLCWPHFVCASAVCEKIFGNSLAVGKRQ